LRPGHRRIEPVVEPLEAGDERESGFSHASTPQTPEMPIRSPASLQRPVVA
jgi:hypothetical protein